MLKVFCLVGFSCRFINQKETWWKFRTLKHSGSCVCQCYAKRGYFVLETEEEWSAKKGQKSRSVLCSRICSKNYVQGKGAPQCEIQGGKKKKKFKEVKWGDAWQQWFWRLTDKLEKVISTVRWKETRLKEFKQQVSGKEIRSLLSKEVCEERGRREMGTVCRNFLKVKR